MTVTQAPANETSAQPRDRGQLLDPAVPIVMYADEWTGLGGTAGYVLMLARDLRRRGYRVAALCHGTDAMAAMRASLTDLGVDVRVLDTGRRSILGHVDRQRALRAVVKDYPGCVIALIMGYHTRGGGMTFAGIGSGSSAIVRADLTPPEPPISVGEKLWLRFKDVFVDRVVVGAYENIDAFAREMGRSKRKMAVVNTGIELERFSPGDGRDAVRAEFGYSDDDLVIGTVCRLDDTRKGVHVLLDALAQVAAAEPRARLLVVGDGILRPGLQAQAERLGVDDRVTFAGWRTDTPQTLAAMDVFVMASLFEGGPTSVLEAMAMSKAVIATRVGMVPEVVADGESGLVVPPGDAASMARAIATLLSDATLRERLGGAARDKALRDFSIAKMVDGYLTVFAEAHRKKVGAT